MSTRPCVHVRANGKVCGSPALRNRDLCYFHAAQRQRRLRIQASERWTKPLQLPLLEDADAVQIAIMDVANAYLADRIEHKKAALILRALQCAATNSRRLTFDVAGDYFVDYDASHYADHDNLWAEQGAALEEEPTPTPDLPPRLDAASESCDPESVHQGEFGGVSVG